MTKVQVQGVSKYFKRQGAALPVLDKVDLCVYQGEFVSIIGPSGCGKTTLLNIIAGVEEPTGGTLLLDGVSTPQRLGTVAYMPQKDLLLPWRTVLGNAALGLEVQGLSRRDAEYRARQLLAAFGLEGFERQYPDALSGGMRQRVALLRTVLTHKPLMLLDEPFGALDALTRAGLQAWLLQLWGSLDRTVILVTHDVDEAVLLSDRVYVMTARPSRIKQILPVPLPRPRHYQMVATQRFGQLKAALLEALWGDARALEGWDEAV